MRPPFSLARISLSFPGFPLFRWKIPFLPPGSRGLCSLVRPSSEAARGVKAGVPVHFSLDAPVCLRYPPGRGTKARNRFLPPHFRQKTNRGFPLGSPLPDGKIPPPGSRAEFFRGRRFPLRPLRAALLLPPLAPAQLVSCHGASNCHGPRLRLTLVRDSVSRRLLFRPGAPRGWASPRSHPPSGRWRHGANNPQAGRWGHLRPIIRTAQHIR